jgi:hypothetical protein
MAPTAILFGAVAAILANAPDFAEPVALLPGDQYYVSTTEFIKGWLELPDPPTGQTKRLPYESERTTKYVEFVLPSSVGAELPDRGYRAYEEMKSKRIVNGQLQVGFALRPEVSKIVLQRGKGIAKPYSPDGPLKFEEIDSQSYLMCAPALNGLLPKGRPAKGNQWNADRESAEHLAGMLPLEAGQLSCALANVLDFQGAKLGQITFTGTLTGLTEEGRARDEVNGALYFDVATGALHSVNVDAERTILDKRQKEVGKLQVHYTMRIRPAPANKRLDVNEMAKIPPRPTAENLAVLYDYPPYAASLLHPRRWVLANAVGPELEFIQKEGRNRLFVEFQDDDKAPSIADYAKQIKAGLDKSGFKLLEEVKEPKENANGDASLGRFELKTEFQRVPFRQQYYIFKDGKRGVIVKSMINEADFEEQDLQRDASWIVTHLTFTRPTAPKPDKVVQAK